MEQLWESVRVTGQLQYSSVCIPNFSATSTANVAPEAWKMQHWLLTFTMDFHYSKSGDYVACYIVRLVKVIDRSLTGLFKKYLLKDQYLTSKYFSLLASKWMMFNAVLTWVSFRTVGSVVAQYSCSNRCTPPLTCMYSVWIHSVWEWRKSLWD